MQEGHVLVVSVADPREGACDTDGDGQVRNDSHNEHGIVVILVVDENQCYAEDEPCKS